RQMGIDQGRTMIARRRRDKGGGKKGMVAGDDRDEAVVWTDAASAFRRERRERGEELARRPAERAVGKNPVLQLEGRVRRMGGGVPFDGAGKRHRFRRAAAAAGSRQARRGRPAWRRRP